MNKVVLDFTIVSREIRSIVSRRRELMLFLGSLFAALGIYLQNMLEGNLPAGIANLEKAAFLTYSLFLLIPTVIIALRVARLHHGMVINGIFYAAILKNSLRPESDPAKAARLNWYGVSTQLFLLTNMIAGFSTSLFVLALGWNAVLAGMAGLAAFVSLLCLFLRFHRQAADFSLKRIVGAETGAPSQNEHEDHIAGSLEDCNHDMLGATMFVGLMLFSVFENLSGLGSIRGRSLDLASTVVQEKGPIVYSLLMTAVCVMGIVIYLRLCISLGGFALQLDPNDDPFRPFKMTDSFLGYCLLAFFLSAAVHLLLVSLFHRLEWWEWLIDVVVLASATAAFPIMQMRNRSKK